MTGSGLLAADLPQIGNRSVPDVRIAISSDGQTPEAPQGRRPVR
jgi:hypothetical protein